MMKAQTKFVCQNCGAEYSRWQGKCDACGEWNSLVETVIQETRNPQRKVSGATPQKLKEVSDLNLERISTGILEVNRVLGGLRDQEGIVPGALIILGGDPGIGKSTLVLQIASYLSQTKKKVLYVSGEESPNQLKIRAGRLRINEDNLWVVSETNLESILGLIEKEKFDLIIIDSIQTIYSETLTSIPGNISQLSFCANCLMDVAKKNHIAFVLVGHVTKEGAIAGPRVLEHLVDVVLYLEGERYGNFRVLRSVKNRFGSTNEVGIFEMEEFGLKEISNPSKVLLEERIEQTPGSIVFAGIEGTRPILLEIQALTSTSSFGYPKRTTSGFDLNRLNLLIAVLQKRVGLNLSNQDVYVNVVGGLLIKEPAADLAVALAIASAFKNKALIKDLVVFGEIGLSGEIRSVTNVPKRLKEAEKLGFKKVLTFPVEEKISDLNLIKTRTLKTAIDLGLK